MNRLISKYGAVGVIDCDLGQPEFTLPGLTSMHIVKDPILKPSHLNLKLPELSFFVGDITSKSDPTVMMESVKLLNCHYLNVRDRMCSDADVKNGDVSNSVSNNRFSILEEDKKSPKTYLPLVVNTDGWIRYMGSEILSSIIKTFQPSHITHLTSEREQTLEAFQSAPDICKIYSLEPGRSTPGSIGKFLYRIIY